MCHGLAFILCEKHKPARVASLLSCFQHVRALYTTDETQGGPEVDYVYGIPCKRCGSPARYNRSCSCMNGHSRRATREPGNIHGPASFYDGKPYQSCGTNKKYQSDRSCVDCKRLRTEARKPNGSSRARTGSKPNRGKMLAKVAEKPKAITFLIIAESVRRSL